MRRIVVIISSRGSKLIFRSSFPFVPLELVTGEREKRRKSVTVWARQSSRARSRIDELLPTLLQLQKGYLTDHIDDNK
jgi:hypothetical protein